MSFQSKWNFDWRIKGAEHPRWSSISIDYGSPLNATVNATRRLGLETVDANKFVSLGEIEGIGGPKTIGPAQFADTFPIYDPISGANTGQTASNQTLMVLMFSRLHSWALEHEEAETPAP